jgi:hypothetical protein
MKRERLEAKVSLSAKRKERRDEKGWFGSKGKQ